MKELPKFKDIRDTYIELDGIVLRISGNWVMLYMASTKERFAKFRLKDIERVKTILFEI